MVTHPNFKAPLSDKKFLYTPPLVTKLNLNKLKGDTRQHDMVVDGKYLRNKHKLEYEIQGIKAYPETTREAKAQPEQPRTAQPRNLKNTNIDLNKNTA